ncbi:MAG: bifunctional 4-hydroxy-2-oxoglutarate aldolase/2-dehydro-3-deoxy-phosphogluconate aldolase [Alphaproteobacteria bacterium]|nr:keto-deoxy-phosphogluconate aldolase [Hyphomonas sp.]MBR9805604.1 bifunctional 4-hydroxy-2-oxoglutarate aldolase/2-dehydro-3-deoxy-phosphogluconate aldolase [Alphaproteobacteria bacterium]
MTQSLETLKAAAGRAPIVPVLVVPDVQSAAPLADALVEGGLTTAEVTLRTASGLAVIEAMKKAQPDLIVGAGTVLTGDDVRNSIQAGADFLVSPGMSPKLLEAIAEYRDITIPGVATASEAMSRNEEGFKMLKLFPAAVAGGVPALKALGGPLPHLTFMPTGGVSTDNAAEYLALPNVIAVGGSWIATEKDIAASAWSEIAAKAKAALQKV